MNPLSWLIPDLSDDKQKLLSRLGVSAGPEIYASVPESMRQAPTSRSAAYEQAIYWLSIAARRADYESLEEDQDALFNHASKLSYQFGEESSLAVLAEARDAIEATQLPQSDKDEITGALNENWWGALGRTTIKWGVMLGVGGGFAYWLYRRRS